MNEIESIVFCEGYHDRAFWQGWLEYLRCTNLGRPAKQSGRVDVRDPWNEKVGDGEFGFCSAGGQFLRVKPCRGDFRKVKKTVAEGWLNREAETWRQDKTSARRVRRLVLSIDSDALASESDAGDPLSLFLCQWLQGFDGDAKVVADGDVSLFGGATTVSLVRWKADDQAEAGLPEKQTLERLVCAAIVAAYPERAEPVQRWLISRPKAPSAGPKHFAFSYMAGWYAEFGSDTFYQKLWKDEQLVEELRSRLDSCAAWRIAEELVN